LRIGLRLLHAVNRLNLDNANNPGHLLTFFLDNVAGPAQSEFADGRIASLRIFNGVVTPSIPEPETYTLMLVGVALVFMTVLRRSLR